MPITPQISNTLANLNGVAFPDTTHGWAEGAIEKEDGSRVGIVVATADGGTHWTQVLETAMQLRDIAFPDILHGWVVGGNPPTILATVDGGGTWRPQTSGIEDDRGLFTATAFPDAQNGWIVGAVSNGGVILATADGGATWRRQAQDAANFADDFRGVAFPDTQHGWAVGSASPEGGSLIIATSNGGETWERQTIPVTNHLGITDLLWGIAFADLNHGLAVGDNGTILATADGGRTWTSKPSGTDARLFRVAFPDVNHGWAVGQANDGTGVTLVTVDGGDTWTPHTSEPNSSEPLWGVAFPDIRHGWLVGVSGTILRSLEVTLLSDRRGLIANPNFSLSRVRGVYFFAGEWRAKGRDGKVISYYEIPVGANDNLYTVHPSDPRHLGWSENDANRSFALDKMLEAGANTVVMSYWGEPGTDRWAYWAPMQTAIGAHNELFAAALGRPLLIMPAIESGNATFPGPFNGRSNSYHFSQDFPGTPSFPAPALVTQVLDLVRRYVLSPEHPEYPEKWLQLYDRNHVPRYAINLLHVASAEIRGDANETFAAGFNWVADAVFATTGVRVGFTLDVLLDGQELPAPVADPGGWQPWFEIHPEALTTPGASVTALWANDIHLDLFAVSGEGTVISIWWDRDEPSGYRPEGWFGIGGETRFQEETSIAAAWANEDHLDLFAVTKDGAMASTWWDRDGGYRAEGWFVIHPETLFESETVVTALWANEDHLDLFAIDSGGVARTIWWDRNEPEGYRADGWIAIHPETRSVPGGELTVRWANPDHLDLFAVTSDHAVSSIWWDRNEPEGYRADGWFSIGNERVFEPGAHVAALWAPAKGIKHLDLFTIDSQGVVRGTWWDDSQQGGYRPEGWFSIKDSNVSFPDPNVSFPGGGTVTAVWISDWELLLVAVGEEHVVYGANFSSVESGWKDWFPIRKGSEAVPGSRVTALVSPDPNHLDMFAGNANGAVISTYHRLSTKDSYVALPESAGGWLEKTDAVLAIQGFIPEIVSDGHEYDFKVNYWRTWQATGIPVFFDVSPGYDGHLVNKRDPYGNDPEWRLALSLAWSDSFKGIVYNTWNGYTEGYVAVPNLEFGDDSWNWIQELFARVI